MLKETVMQLDSGRIYRKYEILFRSLTDLEGYLKSDPKVNGSVFPSQKSIYMPESFAGAPLKTAIQYCHGGYEYGFSTFLALKKEFDQVSLKKANYRRSIPDFVGARPHIPNFIAGTPKTMARLDRATERKFVRVFINLAYSGNTTEGQIRHRGILTLNLVNLLEQHHIGVDLYAFEASYLGQEIFLAEVKLKKPGEVINVGRCYYPLCGKEFVRRVMVRVKESMPFRGDWGVGYGGVLPEKLFRLCVNVGKNDVVIGSPADMGIQGEDIFRDADTFFSKLNLSKEIYVPKYVDLTGVNYGKS